MVGLELREATKFWPNKKANLSKGDMAQSYTVSLQPSDGRTIEEPSTGELAAQAVAATSFKGSVWRSKFLDDAQRWNTHAV